MAEFESQRVDVQLMQSLIGETQFLMSKTWELSLLPTNQAEAVAFLVATTRMCPESMNKEKIESILKFWSLAPAEVEAAIFDLLHIHEEEITDTFEEDVYVLSLLFPTRTPE